MDPTPPGWADFLCPPSWPGWQTPPSPVHSSLYFPPAKPLLPRTPGQSGMTKGSVGVSSTLDDKGCIGLPFGIGCTDPRSQKQDPVQPGQAGAPFDCYRKNESDRHNESVRLFVLFGATTMLR